MTNDAGEQLTSVDEILATRASRYGDFATNALLSQTLQHIILQHAARNPSYKIEPYMAESLTFICQKIARIANGDPSYLDNWVDIAGYAQLVVNEINKKVPHE